MPAGFPSEAGSFRSMPNVSGRSLGSPAAAWMCRWSQSHRASPEGAEPLTRPNPFAERSRHPEAPSEAGGGRGGPPRPERPAPRRPSPTDPPAHRPEGHRDQGHPPGDQGRDEPPSTAERRRANHQRGPPEQEHGKHPQGLADHRHRGEQNPPPSEGGEVDGVQPPRRRTGLEEGEDEPLLGHLPVQGLQLTEPSALTPEAAELGGGRDRGGDGPYRGTPDVPKAVPAGEAEHRGRIHHAGGDASLHHDVALLRRDGWTFTFGGHRFPPGQGDSGPSREAGSWWAAKRRDRRRPS